MVNLYSITLCDLYDYLFINISIDREREREREREIDIEIMQLNYIVYLFSHHKKSI